VVNLPYGPAEPSFELERKSCAMSDHKQLSDAEIADILGDASPIEPIETVPDENSDGQQRFLKSVKPWLIRKVSLADVQTQFRALEEVSSFRSEFEEFVSAATDGHETWEFSSPQSNWERLAGCSGFALVKDDEVTHAIVTVVS